MRSRPENSNPLSPLFSLGNGEWGIVEAKCIVTLADAYLGNPERGNRPAGVNGASVAPNSGISNGQSPPFPQDNLTVK